MTWEVEIDTPVPGTPGASGGLAVDADGNIYAIIADAIVRWDGSNWVSEIGNAQGGYGLTIRPSNGAFYYIYDNDGAFWKHDGSWASLIEPSGIELDHGRSLAFGDENSDYDLYYLNVDTSVRIYGANLNSDGRIPNASSWVRIVNDDWPFSNAFGGMAVKGNYAYLVASPEQYSTDPNSLGVYKYDISTTTTAHYDEVLPAHRGVGLAFDGDDLLRLGADGKVYRFVDFDIQKLVESPRRLTGEDRYYALEITHPTASGFPLRLVSDNRDHTIDGENYTALAFRALPPNFVDGEEPQAVLEIDNVGKVLTDVVQESKGGRGAKMRVMQVVRGEDESEVVWDLPALPVGVTSMNAQSVQVTLAYRSGRHRPAIKWRHTHEVSPGLY